MLVVVLPLVLGALLWGASALSDGNRIPGLLAHAAKESGVMYCTEGRIVHGDGSLRRPRGRGGHLPLHRLEAARRRQLHGQGRHALADLAASLTASVTRRTAAAALLAGLAACTTRPKFTGLPIVRKIAFIPASEPLQFVLENKNQTLAAIFPIASLAYSLDSKEKRKRFNQVLSSPRPSLAPQLNEVVVAALRGAGYPVEVLDTLARDPEDPDDIDYDKVVTDAEAILQLRFREVGLLSPSSSTSYLPQVNIDGKLYIRSRDDSVYDEGLYYGVDAKPGKPWAIAGDPRYAYAYFDLILERIAEVRESFSTATAALADLMAVQLREALATRTTRG